MIGGDLPHLNHGGERAAHLRHLIGAGVEGHHRGTAAGGLERMAPEPAPEVQDAIPGSHPEPVVVNRQHQAAPWASVASRPSTAANGAPGSGLPAMTAS